MGKTKFFVKLHTFSASSLPITLLLRDVLPHQVFIILQLNSLRLCLLSSFQCWRSFPQRRLGSLQIHSHPLCPSCFWGNMDRIIRGQSGQTHLSLSLMFSHIPHSLITCAIVHLWNFLSWSLDWEEVCHWSLGCWPTPAWPRHGCVSVASLSISINLSMREEFCLSFSLSWMMDVRMHHACCCPTGHSECSHDVSLIFNEQALSPLIFTHLLLGPSSSAWHYFGFRRQPTCLCLSFLKYFYHIPVCYLHVNRKVLLLAPLASCVISPSSLM